MILLLAIVGAVTMGYVVGQKLANRKFFAWFDQNTDKYPDE